MKIVNALKESGHWILLYLGAMIFVFSVGNLMSSCGSTKANGSSSARAIEIPGPAGVRCYAILDGNNAAVGGNCN